MKIQISEVPNVPRYCRKLMKEEGYPKTIYLYRDDMLCLTVDVEKASKLRLVENSKEGPMYKKYYGSPEDSLESFLKGGKNVSRTDRTEV